MAIKGNKKTLENLKNNAKPIDESVSLNQWLDCEKNVKASGNMMEQGWMNV